MLDKTPGTNGKTGREAPSLNGPSRTLPTAFQRPAMAGEADVLAVPWTVRFRWEWNNMVRETARQTGVNPEGKWRYAPWTAIALTLLLSAGAAVMAHGVFKGRTEAQEEIARDNRAAVTKALDENRAIMERGVDKLTTSMNDMRSELMGKVEAIQGSVASTQQSMARAEARIDSLSKENDRLQVNLDVEEMMRRKLENKLRAQGIEVD